jgi:hypothetical protein
MVFGCLIAAQLSAHAQGFTIFDPPGSVLGTFPSSINDAGQVTGYYVDSGFVSHGFVLDAVGAITSFDPPGSTGTFPSSMNNSGQITGSYVDSGGVYHGFVRDARGTITSFDPPGSIGNLPSSINNAREITGRYFDSVSGHGFVRSR